MIKVTNIGYDLTEFNYTSDIHLDSIENSLDNMGEVINSLTSNVQKTDTLIIMGDFANNNEYTERFLEEIHKYFKLVIITDGNHDSYFDKQSGKLEDRINRLKKAIEPIENIIFLEPETSILEFNNGIRLAGCNLWYDLDNPNALWDFNNIQDKRYIDYGYIIEKSKEHKDFYNKVINEVDIFVSHVPIINQHFDTFGDGCFYRRLGLYSHKICLFGHMHEGYCEHLKAMNTFLLTKPIGYNMSNNKKIGYFNMEEFMKNKGENNR